MDGKKRARDLKETDPSTGKRTRAASAAAHADDLQKQQLEQEHGKLHTLADTYVELASNIVLYEQDQLGPYGYNPAENSWPLQCVSTLQYIQSKLRRGSVLERWSPLEIATFEAAMAIHGKVFDKVQKEIRTKSCQEIIDFYYVWKKTQHYERWKSEYVPPYMDHSDDDDDDEDGKVDASKKDDENAAAKVNKRGGKAK